MHVRLQQQCQEQLMHDGVQTMGNCAVNGYLLSMTGKLLHGRGQCMVTVSSMHVGAQNV